MEDMRGVQIYDGDEVVYASRKGSSVLMRRGMVEFGEAFTGLLRVRKLDGKKGLVNLRRLDHVVVVSLCPTADRSLPAQVPLTQ